MTWFRHINHIRDTGIKQKHTYRYRWTFYQISARSMTTHNDTVHWITFCKIFMFQIYGALRYILVNYSNISCLRKCACPCMSSGLLKFLGDEFWVVSRKITPLKFIVRMNSVNTQFLCINKLYSYSCYTFEEECFGGGIGEEGGCLLGNLSLLCYSFSIF